MPARAGEVRRIMMRQKARASPASLPLVLSAGTPCIRVTRTGDGLALGISGRKIPDLLPHGRTKIVLVAVVGQAIQELITTMEGPAGDGDDDRHDRQSEDEDNVPTWDSLGEAVRRRGPLLVIRLLVEPMLAGRRSAASERPRIRTPRVGSCFGGRSARSPRPSSGSGPLRRSVSFVAPGPAGRRQPVGCPSCTRGRRRGPRPLEHDPVPRGAVAAIPS
jgi:hypothetical protein